MVNLVFKGRPFLKRCPYHSEYESILVGINPSQIIHSLEVFTLYPWHRKTGKMVQKNPCQGKHREFGNFAKTQEKHREFCLLKL